MSGICGIVHNSLSLQGESSFLVEMLEALGGGNPQEYTSLGPVAMGVRGFKGKISGISEKKINGGALAMAFHGSIYNLSDLNSRTHAPSDAAGILLDNYLREGMEFVQKLRGEFCLALWDGRIDRLHVVTDRFRVQPVLYYVDSEKLVFASRMKGLLACPGISGTTIDPWAVADVVGTSAIPTPRTIFREIKKIPPGNILTFHKGELRVEPYWDINFLDPAASATEAELAARLKEEFSDAVSVRLGTDSNECFGTFLSGGIDSSVVTGVISGLSDLPIKSFSIGFGEHRFNEINYARIAARIFEAEHFEYFVSSQDACDAIPVLIESFDEPYGNASAVPTYFCAKVAKENGVDILYAGDGGDELFAGNERYATQRLLGYYHRIPALVREPLIKPLVFTMADILKHQVLAKGKKYIQRASMSFPERLTSYEIYNFIPLNELFEGDFLNSMGLKYDSSEAIHRHCLNALAQTELDRQLYIDLKLTISDNDILKVIRMTEAAGVTARFPFLDHNLAEFAASVPARIKMRGRKLRSFFKNAYAELLPEEIVNKTKHGFGLPIPMWLRTDKRLNEMMRDLLLSPRSQQRGYFRKKALEDLMELHSRDTTSFYGTVLWHIMAIELWHRRYVDQG